MCSSTTPAYRKIRIKEKRFLQVKTEIGENASRVEIMSEHLKNVKQELLHTQELLSAKQKEVTSEEHMKQLAEREIGRVAQEMRRFDADCSELETKLNTVQNFLFKGNEDMDKFKLQMNWNQDEMEQWEQDNSAMQHIDPIRLPALYPAWSRALGLTGSHLHRCQGSANCSTI